MDKLSIDDVYDLMGVYGLPITVEQMVSPEDLEDERLAKLVENAIQSMKELKDFIVENQTVDSLEDARDKADFESGIYNI